ncbi:hypothetical protein AALO_G00255250 [Alosa alosa]|uniref:Uncharacterized protein n=1 Tax=Alosa alosa TaxID=278164 RepID=A0AAV6FTI2_9TELE|nr:hypothetical protein AALO_G00255250 [Alosa alosa]
MCCFSDAPHLSPINPPERQRLMGPTAGTGKHLGLLRFPRWLRGRPALQRWRMLLELEHLPRPKSKGDFWAGEPSCHIERAPWGSAQQECAQRTWEACATLCCCAHRDGAPH